MCDIYRLCLAGFFLFASIMAGIFGYSILYWWLVPSLHYSKEVYFDYTIKPFPRALINVASEEEYYLFDIPFQNYLLNTKQSSNLIKNQFYDIKLSMRIPNRPATITGDIGALNAKLSLYSCQSHLLTTTTDDTRSDTINIHSSVDDNNNNNNGMNDNVIINGQKNRFSELFYSDFELNEIIEKFDLSLVKHIQKPIIINFESYIVYNFKKLIFLIPYAIGLFKDEQFISVDMLNGYQESSVKFFFHFSEISRFFFFCSLLLCFFNKKN